MNKFKLLVSAMALTGQVSFGGLARAQDAQAVAARFGALESVQQISLSPDGAKVAYVVPHPTVGTVVKVADLVTGDSRQVIASHSKDEQIYWCGWSSDIRLICKIYIVYNNAGQLLGFTRTYALDADGNNVVMLSATTSGRVSGIMQSGGDVIDWDVTNKPETVLMSRAFVSQDRRDSNIASEKPGWGVEEVDTRSVKRHTIEHARTDAVEYISDGHGNVRILGAISSDADGYLRSKLKYYYRKSGEKDWLELSKVDINAVGLGGFTPYAVDSKRNVVYGFDDHDGRAALYSVSLDGSSVRQLELGRPDVDVDELVRIGRDGRVVGASYATERRTVEYFDPELKKLAAALGKVLPGQPLISWIDASANETKLLLLASSDTDPGKFFLFDKGTRQLGAVLPVRPELAGIAQATMKAISFPAADGTQIPAYLTLPLGSAGKNIPAIVMPHGGPGARDELGV